jgi:hypothetical protein
MNGFNGSAIKYISALSPLEVAAAGSTNPFDLSDGRWLNVLVHADGAVVVNIERSGTSNGTFNQVGCSILGDASGLAVRSLPLQSSAVWYKASYVGTGLTSIIFEVQGQRKIPVDQDANTTVYSDVIV